MEHFHIRVLAQLGGERQNYQNFISHLEADTVRCIVGVPL